VARLWFAVIPWRDLQAPTDPLLNDKVRNIVHLYWLRRKGPVLCADEKSHIWALDRTQAILPLVPGLPARRTHGYKRREITILIAALDIAKRELAMSNVRHHPRARKRRLIFASSGPCKVIGAQ
jgi:hypothetical protein